MLTKLDLKEIRKVIREEVEVESQNIKEEIQAEMKMNLVRILTEVRESKDRLKNVEIVVRKIQKDLKEAVNFLDKEGLKITKRLEKVEDHLDLEPASP